MASLTGKTDDKFDRQIFQANSTDLHKRWLRYKNTLYIPYGFRADGTTVLLGHRASADKGADDKICFFRQKSQQKDPSTGRSLSKRLAG